MVTVLLSILSALGGLAKQTWSFVKAKALLLWGLLMFIDRVHNSWITRRAIQFACIAFIFYSIYTVLSSAISLAVVTVDLNVGISELIAHSGWAGWIVWEGPMNLRVLWHQFLSVVAFRFSILTCIWLVTKIDYFTSSIFIGSYGPRR